MQDTLCGGHWIPDEATSKAAFDFAVTIFGTDGAYTKSQWFAQIRYYMKTISPFVDTPVLMVPQVQEWVKLTKAAMAARKWSNASATPE